MHDVTHVLDVLPLLDHLLQVQGRLLLIVSLSVERSNQLSESQQSCFNDLEEVDKHAMLDPDDGLLLIRFTTLDLLIHPGVVEHEIVSMVHLNVLHIH